MKLVEYYCTDFLQTKATVTISGFLSHSLWILVNTCLNYVYTSIFSTYLNSYILLTYVWILGSWQHCSDLVPKVLLSLKLCEMPLLVNLQFQSSFMLFNCFYWRNLISEKKIEKLF